MELLGVGHKLEVEAQVLVDGHVVEHICIELRAISDLSPDLCDIVANVELVIDPGIIDEVIDVFTS